MGILKYVRLALKWLGFGNAIMTNPIFGEAATRAFGEKITETLPRYVAKLLKLEQDFENMDGVFVAIADAKNSGTGLQLSADQVRYLFFFKRLWDKYFKKYIRRGTDAVNFDDFEELAELGDGLSAGDDDDVPISG